MLRGLAETDDHCSGGWTSERVKGNGLCLLRIGADRTTHNHDQRNRYGPCTASHP
jgi:hypothetical protein